MLDCGRRVVGLVTLPLKVTVVLAVGTALGASAPESPDTRRSPSPETELTVAVARSPVIGSAENATPAASASTMR